MKTKMVLIAYFTLILRDINCKLSCAKGKHGNIYIVSTWTQNNANHGKTNIKINDYGMTPEEFVKMEEKMEEKNKGKNHVYAGLVMPDPAPHGQYTFDICNLETEKCVPGGSAGVYGGESNFTSNDKVLVNSIESVFNDFLSR